MTDEKSLDTKPKRKITHSFVAIVSLFTIILIGFSLSYNDSRHKSANDTQLLKATAKLSQETSDLSKANSDRIGDIQASRTSSCKQTYTGIREVFRPFLPTNPTTQQQIEFLEKFNSTIDRLIKGCEEQTDPDKPKPPKNGG